MSDLETVIDRYVDAWNESDGAARLAFIRQALSERSRYCDPLSDVEGHDGFSAMVDGVQQQLPDHHLRRTSPVERHHDQIRFEWELVAPDGTVAVAGVDYGVLAGDGRLQSVAGFFGAGVPAEAAA